MEYSYEEKYLKYKKKYLDLKNSIGGAPIIPATGNVGTFKKIFKLYDEGKNGITANGDIKGDLYRFGYNKGGKLTLIQQTYDPTTKKLKDTATINSVNVLNLVDDVVADLTDFRQGSLNWIATLNDQSDLSGAEARITADISGATHAGNLVEAEILEIYKELLDIKKDQITLTKDLSESQDQVALDTTQINDLILNFTQLETIYQNK